MTDSSGPGTTAPCRLPLLVSLLAVGCAPIAGPVTVEAVVHDKEAEGGVALADVVLETVTDLSSGAGAWFDVRGGVRLGVLDVRNSLEAGDAADAMVARLRGNGGHPLSPHMAFDGERWVAEDQATLVVFSAWHAFEEGLRFADTLGPPGPWRDHGLLALDGQMVVSGFFPVPLVASDNAAYAPPIDAWLLLRAVLQEGVPFAMTTPVLAHELYHRVFHRSVFASPEAFAVFRELAGSTSDTPTDAARRRTLRLLKGVDEGLADLFSLAATRDVDGIPRSFRLAGGRYQSEADRRDLEGAFAQDVTFDGLRTGVMDDALRACGVTDSEDPLGEETFNFYCLGTVFARALWEGSARDMEVLRGEVLPAVQRALPQVGDALGSGVTFDAHVFLAPLVAELAPGTRRAEVCAALAARFASVVEAASVPGC